MEKEGKKVIFGLVFANFSKPKPQTRKVGKLALRGGRNISKRVDFTSFGALRKKCSVSSLRS